MKYKEAKRMLEQERAFYLRKYYRAIRAAARRVDPNSGFRLSAKSQAAAASLRESVAKIDAMRLAEAARIAAIPKRDRMMASREVGTTRLPSRSR